MSYVRFVVQHIDEDSARRQGLFVALGRLQRSGEMFEHEEHEYLACRRWFGDRLPVPARFARARRNHPRAIALCWFRCEAIAHIERMRSMASILEAHGIHVEVLTSRRPGYIVYEDEHQITAVAFADTSA